MERRITPDLSSRIVQLEVCSWPARVKNRMYARVNGEWVAGQDLLLARSGDNGRSVVVEREAGQKPKEVSN